MTDASTMPKGSSDSPLLKFDHQRTLIIRALRGRADKNAVLSSCMNFQEELKEQLTFLRNEREKLLSMNSASLREKEAGS